jgi:hypothetical protein
LQRIRKMLHQQNWRSAPKPFSKNRSTGRLEEFCFCGSAVCFSEMPRMSALGH